MAREVEARLRLSAVDRTAKAFGSVEKRLSSVERHVGRVNKAQAAFARSADGMMLASARFLGPAALAAGAAGSLRRFASVERQIDRIGITAGATADKTKQAFGVIDKAASDYAMGQDEITSGLDSLVASGRDLESALSFLPSVAATAQAAGADIVSIATTADAVGANFDIAGDKMQNAFDILVEAGKLGKFELRDMANYLPTLTPAFAALGYRGEAAVRKIAASLQVVRAGTGSAEEAATAYSNVLQKMETEETAKRFSKFGIDLRKEMAKARKEGKDLVDVFVDLSDKAIKGDLSKLPQLFGDAQMITGMRALLNGTGDLAVYMEKLGHATGSVKGDLDRILDGTQARIDRMGTSWDKLIKAVGGGVATVAVPAMDAISASIDDETAFSAGIDREKKRGGTEDAALSAYADKWQKIHGDRLLGKYARELQADFRKDMGAFGRGDLANPYARLSALQKPNNSAMATSPELPSRRQDPVSLSTGGPSQMLPGSEAPKPFVRPSALQDMAAQYAEYARGRQSVPSAIARYSRVNPDIGPSPADVNAALVRAMENAGRQPLAPRSVDHFLYGSAAEPNFNAKEHFRIGPEKDPASVDPDALRQAMEGGGSSAQQSIETAARSINEQAETAGSTFANMLAGLGAQFGQDAGASFGAAAASSFSANVKIPLPNGGTTTSRQGSVSPPSRNLGVSMPDVGTPGGSP
ncbi:phage tail tape measure protein [Tianweitania sp. BSSL-BM11]|uniref:Phage tail tape measure protein n=1 Tax=Tianweitania aestuarii TaxID=2814886 RepID=A0ABS5RSY7_9HYPH|nr:phage tail tape measure protein [Tianweitania aestuarii]MBS9720173.1 phage tail tape measure protein [Tianweitania aestuarii]